MVREGPGRPERGRLVLHAGRQDRDLVGPPSIEAPRRRPGRGLAGVLALGLLSGSSGAQEPDGRAEPPFELVGASAFTDHFGPARIGAFSVVAADADLDGDPDLLVNWHHIHPLELFENEGASFRRINAPGRDVTGVFDNPGVPDLYVETDEMLRRIDDGGEPGLYLWHDPDRHPTIWRFAWRDPDDRYGELRIELRTNSSWIAVDGLEEGELVEEGPDRRDVRLAADARSRSFQARAAQISPRLGVRLAVDPADPTPPVFVGRERTAFRDGEVSVWKADPHGLVWLDLEGTEHPELYLTRGALMGSLAPPAEPKVERYFVHRGGGEPLYRRADPDVVPADYSRSRRVECVDVNGDGALDLAIAAKRSANRVLVRDPRSGRFVDRAEEYGLTLVDSEVQAWSDYDGDGRQDLFYLDGDVVNVALNRPEPPFERIDGRELGLVLSGKGGVDTSTDLRILDFDNDGELDLWVLGQGARRTPRFFRRDGDRFRDASAEIGIPDVGGDSVLVFLDVDNDGFEDVVRFGKLPRTAFQRATLALFRKIQAFPPRFVWARGTAHLWRNVGGKRLEVGSFSDDVVPERIHAATSCDVDGDGRMDVVAVGLERHLLRNTSKSKNSHLGVKLSSRGGSPIGALVVACYGDGTRRACRWGSAHNASGTQSALPLHFGIPSGVTLDEIRVRWPGEREEIRYDVGETNAVVVLER